MKGLRVLELSEALNVDNADLIAVCAILKITLKRIFLMKLKKLSLTIKKIIFLILQQKIFLVMNKLFHSLQV